MYELTLCKEEKSQRDISRRILKSDPNVNLKVRWNSQGEAFKRQGMSYWAIGMIIRDDRNEARSKTNLIVN